MAREPCVLKQAARHLKTPGLISLGGGLPHPSNFPIERLEVTVAAPDGRGDNVIVSMGKYDASPALAATAAAVATLTKPATVTLNGSNGHTGNGTVRHPMKKPTTEESLLIPEEYDLATALNYNQAQGSPQLLRWVTEHTELVHSPPYSDWACSLTIGATGALEQALRMLCSGERGDAMLTEEFSFSTALETALPLGVRIVGVPVDAEGLVPNELDRIMADWREDVQGRRPHVLYTVPSGQNPTGATQGLERRREVMECARRWDLVVIEDDPYYYLQMDEHRANDSSNTTGNGTNGSVSAPPRTPQAAETVDAFLENLLPSLLSLDRDGRVLRLDSFSKVLVPGARLGWVTGPNQLVERYIRHAEVASQGPSGISQAVLWAIIDREWGHEGLLRWLMRIRGEYGRRRDALLDACEKFLPRGVVTWVPPRAGMFVSFYLIVFMYH